jgi:IS5 family transposase
MRPRERRETGEQDLFRSRLDQIIDMKHPLVALARTVDWGFLEGRFGEVYTDDPGQPPLPTRLMAGLAILKHTYDLSDEVLCERWVENCAYRKSSPSILVMQSAQDRTGQNASCCLGGT